MKITKEKVVEELLKSFMAYMEIAVTNIPDSCIASAIISRVADEHRAKAWVLIKWIPGSKAKEEFIGVDLRKGREYKKRRGD